MFTSDMIEAHKSEIHINGMEFETMNLLVSFAYTGELRISTGNVQSLMMGANFWQLLEVVQQGSLFLISRLHSSNVLYIRSFCFSMCCEESVIKKANSFLQKHFLAISREAEFVNLSEDEVVELLNFDELYVDSEEDIFTAAIRWLQHEPSRNASSARILSCVRLPLLKPSFLADIVATNKLIKEDLACRDLVDEAKDYHLIPERRPLMKSFRLKARQCHDVPGLIFALGGLMKPCETRSAVEIYDPILKKWTAAKEMSTVRSRVGVAVEHRQVYAIGGFNGQDRLKLVEIKSVLMKLLVFIWIAPLRRKRSALAAAFLHNRLYVCGGYDGIISLSSVEVYDPDKNVWEDGPDMIKQRSASGVAVLEGYIYVLGGHDGMTIFNSVERFDPETQKWEMMPSMTTKRCRLGATAYNGKIYACGGYDGSSFLKSAECFDVKTMRWTPVTPMNICRSRVSLAANIDGLYAIAGYDGENNLCSVEVYDEDSDSWKLTTPLQTHEGGVGVGVIPIPPFML
ncbi:unnamed protein product [Caenorhabditis auriculariae]|uniref:BTB domain-containing protein n=1 Tax=Caenorhabditis auriculariae TaxID=2777116 RepID=A0A8S1HWH3_9PELO|nr:unnamed protein product [Caenorhabditis auriculariae]